MLLKYQILELDITEKKPYSVSVKICLPDKYQWKGVIFSFTNITPKRKSVNKTALSYQLEIINNFNVPIDMDEANLVAEEFIDFFEKHIYTIRV